ncbi:MAG: HAMP domain-containing sensor histidine kinase [Candidatus Brocadiia bacterium]
MSLRYKILIALASVMILILGILTLNLWVNALARVHSNQQKMADVLTSIIQDWLKDIKSPPAPPSENSEWAGLRDKLNNSALFTKWVIVNNKLEPILSATPIVDAATFKNDADLIKALKQQKPVFSLAGGTVVNTPLRMSDNTVLLIKMDIQRPQGMELDPMESLKTILWVMPLGTIFLILSMYVLMTKLILRPIEALSEASRQISSGNYKVTLPTVKGNDEVANLVNTFKIMLDEINSYHSSLQAKIDDAREKIKATQEQLVIAQRLSATGTLAAGIAHEINNPLGGILNAAMSLKDGKLDAKRTKEYLELIIEGLTRIQDTLKKILQFFPRRLTPQPIELKMIMATAIQLVQHRLTQDKITISNRLDMDIPPVFGDSGELQQVFINLLLNAIDAVAAKHGLHDGKIEVYHEIADRNITVFIKDNGTGMKEEDLSRAFDLFYTTKEPGKGTGLGLSVAHNIIQGHGGKLVMESQYGKGTTVKVTLPILDKSMESKMK